MRTRLLLLFSAFLALQALAADKVSPDEVIKKSIESVGPPEVRVPPNGRELDCNGTWQYITGGHGGLQGTCYFQTKGNMSHWNLTFQNTAYPGEDIVYNGEGKPIFRQVSAGQKSPLANFINDNPVMIRNGLFGGVLNEDWPLFDFEKSGAKLEPKGEKKVDGKKMNVFEYKGPKQADTKIFLYFDPQTNQHYMTEYRATEPATNSGDIAHPSGRDAVTTVSERFTEFRTIGQLNIPLVWTIRFEQEQGTVQQWQMTFTKQKLTLPEDAFSEK